VVVILAVSSCVLEMTQGSDMATIGH